MFTDSAYVRIGNNVHFATCSVIGHDGAAGMLEAARGVPFDGTGKVDIRENVFIGHEAIILPGVTIGPDAILGMGSGDPRRATRGGSGGVPATQISTVDEVLARRKAETDSPPWKELIAQRKTFVDRAMEGTLRAARRPYFYADA